MRRFACIPLIAISFAMSPAVASAQQLFYLKLQPEKDGGAEKGATRAVEAFVEGIPETAEDPTSLGKYSRIHLWSVRSGSPTPERFRLKLEGEKLKETIPSAPGLAVVGEYVSAAQQGSGGEPVLTRYYPKTVAGAPDELNRLAPIPHAHLEIIPKFREDSVTFTALYDGKPLEGAEIFVKDELFEEHGGTLETDLKTDKDGEATWAIPDDGMYIAYLRHEIDREVVSEKAEYNGIVDVATLTFGWPLIQTGPRALWHKVQKAAKQNMLGALVLFFFLGFVAALIKSDLKFPVEGYQLIVIYLLLSIGYEGGHMLKAEKDLATALIPMGTGFAVNALASVVAIFLLLKVFRFDVPNSCALGALYGSDSAGLFAVAMSLVKGFDMSYEGFMVATLAVMEIPGVIVGIVMYQMLKGRKKEGHEHGPEHGHAPAGLLPILIHELKSPGVYMLLGGILVGYFTVNSEYIKTEPFFITPFKGIMCLFLFENGLKAGGQVSALKHGAGRLITFGVLFPLITGTLAVFLAKGLGLAPGSAILFAILVAAPSNIAAPAAMRLAIPEANPSVYFTTSLGVSFPALVVLGIPWFYIVTQTLYGL